MGPWQTRRAKGREQRPKVRRWPFWRPPPSRGGPCGSARPPRGWETKGTIELGPRWRRVISAPTRGSPCPGPPALCAEDRRLKMVLGASNDVRLLGALRLQAELSGWWRAVNLLCPDPRGTSPGADLPRPTTKVYRGQGTSTVCGHEEG